MLAHRPQLGFQLSFQKLLFRMIFESGHFVLAVLIYLETARSGSCNLIGGIYFKDFVDIPPSLRNGMQTGREEEALGRNHQPMKIVLYQISLLSGHKKSPRKLLTRGAV